MPASSPDLGALRSAASEEAALEDLHALGCTDGLPVVIPTVDRVRRMAASAGLDLDLSLGEIGPLGGRATIERVAACAVMAGCVPDVFPLVLAAAKALCDVRLDMGVVQATTHNLGPMVIVNGPGRLLGPMESGTGALGPGNRHNASLGRAVRLCLINIGGGRPGIGDMALLGHPGKFTQCLAEAEEDSPFPPLHTTLGYSADDTAVTIVNVEAPHSVLCVVTRDAQESSDRLLRQLATAVASPASNNAGAGSGHVVLVLNPEHARTLAAAGLDRQGIQQAVFELARNRRGDVLAQPAPAGSDPEEELAALASPESVVVVVAGGGGTYSAVMPSWGLGAHGNRPITVEAAVGMACEIPQAAAAAVSSPGA